MNLKTDKSQFLIIAAVALIILSGFAVSRKKNQYREAMNLPFNDVQLESIEDGVYYGKTYTSFLRLQLEVKVENHQLVEINVLENMGIDGEEARPILDKMIKENKVIVSAIKGSELGCLQYISCVCSALTSTDEKR